MDTQTCTYCGAARLASEMKQGRIFFRRSRMDPRTGKMKSFVADRQGWYCVDKNFLAHHQATYEG